MRRKKKLDQNAPNDATRALKIAMIGHKRIPSREGGVEIVVEELSTRMVALGHQVYAYNRRGKHIAGIQHDLENNIKTYKGVKLIQVVTVDIKGIAALVYSLLATLHALFCGYDVFHYHALGPSAMLWLPRLFGKHTVATIHGLDWQRGKWGGMASRYLKFGERVAARCADEVIVLSENMGHYFEETYKRKTCVIPNGVEEPTPLDDSLLNKRWGIKKDEYILFLGRIVPEKGIRCLLDAYRGLECDKKLVIAGSPSDTGTFLQQVFEKAQQDARVLFTGFVQGNDLAALYSNAYLYVLPSDVEGMPLSLLEAMSYGNCCVGSDIPEIAEVLGDHGVTFRHGDAQDLQEKLSALLLDPVRTRTLRDTSYAYVCKRYDWDDVTQQTLELYGEHKKRRQECADEDIAYK